MLFNFVILALHSMICVSALYFSGETDCRVRKHLLGILNSYYSDGIGLDDSMNPYEPLPVSESSIGVMYRLPLDIQWLATVEHLDFVSLLKCIQLNKKFSIIVKYATHRFLGNYSRHFVSSDSFMNVLLYVILRDHFKDSKSLASANIYDNFELLCAKYFYGDLNFKLIPANVYFYFICFFNELIYGVDVLTPAYKSEFLSRFTCKLTQRSSYIEYEKTLNYLSLIYADDLDDVLERSFIASCMFFNEAIRSVEEVKEFFEIVDLDISRSRVPSYFKMAITEIFTDEFSNADLERMILSHFLELDKFPRRLFDRLSLPSVMNIINKIRPSSLQYAAVFNAASFRLGGNPESVADRFYMYCRTSMHQFSVDSIEITYWTDHLISVVGSSSYSLAQLDFFISALRSDYLQAYDIDSAFFSCVSHANVVLFDAFVKESGKCFNTVIFNKAIPVWESLPFSRNLAMSHSFFNLLNSDDPLIFLTMWLEAMINLKKHFEIPIFNMHKRYIFDNGIIFFARSFPKIDKLRGQTLCFKEILKFLAVPELFDFFSASLKHFEDVPDDSNPPVSLNDYVYGHISPYFNQA
jgi:hypothetical protein